MTSSWRNSSDLRKPISIDDDDFLTEDKYDAMIENQRRLIIAKRESEQRAKEEQQKRSYFMRESPNPRYISPQVHEPFDGKMEEMMYKEIIENLLSAINLLNNVCMVMLIIVIVIVTVALIGRPIIGMLQMPLPLPNSAIGQVAAITKT